MSILRPAAKLTHRGAMAVLEAALAAAERLSIPQCIAIVDDGTNLLAFCRMDGSRVLSVESATRKAMTAASTGLPTGNLPEEKALLLAEATSGRMTNLPGGLPLMVDGMVVGAIGVGSGTSDQDVEIARIGVAAFEKLLGEDDQR
ncbi:MAG: heme-binding protein [Martelella sp.]|uniref:GlcG/HbpS family heme-binding protein n=1 Tax=Martelella sp. TaxID=1969699 RepID=UPI003242F98B